MQVERYERGTEADVMVSEVRTRRTAAPSCTRQLVRSVEKRAPAQQALEVQVGVVLPGVADTAEDLDGRYRRRRRAGRRTPWCAALPNVVPRDFLRRRPIRRGSRRCGRARLSRTCRRTGAGPPGTRRSAGRIGAVLWRIRRRGSGLPVPHRARQRPRRSSRHRPGPRRSRQTRGTQTLGGRLIEPYDEIACGSGRFRSAG